jgi:hypothetical protein
MKAPAINRASFWQQWWSMVLAGMLSHNSKINIRNQSKGLLWSVAGVAPQSYGGAQRVTTR